MHFWASVHDWSGESDIAQGQKLSYPGDHAAVRRPSRERRPPTWYQESGPSLFVAGARRAVFVTGALTRQELIAFAEGLKPVPSANASR